MLGYVFHAPLSCILRQCFNQHHGKINNILPELSMLVHSALKVVQSKDYVVQNNSSKHLLIELFSIQTRAANSVV